MASKKLIRVRSKLAAALKAEQARIRPKVDAKMAELYRKGEASLSFLGARFRLSHETVRSRLIAQGVELRPATFREPQFYRAKAIKHRAEADRLDAIAAHLIEHPAKHPPEALLTRTTGL